MLQNRQPAVSSSGRCYNERFERLGPALSTHPMFPAGTNVEFAQVDGRDRDAF